jgi:hypothetical protein
MSEYETKESSHTVNSFAIAGLLAIKIATSHPGLEMVALDELQYTRNVYHASVTPSSLDQYRNAITGEYYQAHDPSEGIAWTMLNPQIIQLNNWVDSATILKKWEAEGVPPPTSECRRLAKSVVLQLLKEHQLYPSRISATIEEGIFVNYVNHVNNRHLSIEVYNDLDIAAIVNRDKEMIASTDISNEDFSKIIEIFQAG